MPFPLPHLLARVLAGLGLACSPILAQTPIITEFLADSRDTDDWIEIHNPHPTAHSLTGMQLRDGASAWTFPDITLAPDAFLVILATGSSGQRESGTWTANFRLSAEGEALALLDASGAPVSVFAEVPPQRAGVSYGLDPRGQTAFFPEPTPGAANNDGVRGFVADTRFSVKRGLYHQPFLLRISTATEGATILYTTNGEAPQLGDEPATHVYSQPIAIDGTTVIRALAFKEGFAPTNVDTQTYIFPDEVLHQPAEPPGLPLTWGEFTGTNGSVRGRPVPADYEMNPAMVNEDPDAVKDALHSLPSLSVVMHPEDLFGTNGILANPFGAIDGSGVHTTNPFVRDRPASVEWIDPRGGPEMQIDCGLRLSGGWSRHYIATPKKSFSLLFKKAFGPAKLEFPLFPDSPVQSFDRLVLKAIFSNAWPDAARPPDYLRDHFTRQTRLDMGEPSARSTWVHLYLNGLYWGIYNPTERPDASFAASHFGGQKEDYDAVKHAGLTGPGQATTDRHEVIDGTAAKWTEALTLARRGLESEANYQEISKLVDVVNLADYSILNIYAANVDWPHKNWYALSQRHGGPGFRFFSWDAEYAWHDLDVDRTTVSNRNTPAELYSRIRQNKEFQRLFGDRIHRHLFGNGALTPEANVARFEKMAAVLEPAILAEAARWGDHGNTRQGRTQFTVDHWVRAKDEIIHRFLGQRHDKALQQFIDADLYPELEAPVLSLPEGDLQPGAVLTMRSRHQKNLLKPAGGEIYYTLDGSDPRLADGRRSELAERYSAPLTLTDSVVLRARLLQENLFTGGSWSALSEAHYRVGAVPATSANLILTKIHYHPQDPSESERAAGHARADDFEYLEFLNVSQQTLHFQDVRFVRGIDFQFPSRLTLSPGARLLLARDLQAFERRHGSSLTPIGPYQGNLGNGGERLTLRAADGETIVDLRYHDGDPWPAEADGSGAALVLLDPLSRPDLGDPLAWSALPHAGSPGHNPFSQDPLVAWMAGRDLVTLTASDLFTFAFATDILPSTAPVAVVLEDGHMLSITYQKRQETGDLLYEVESSSDLLHWESQRVPEQSHSLSPGVVRVTAGPLSRELGTYFRIVVTRIP